MHRAFSGNVTTWTLGPAALVLAASTLAACEPTDEFYEPDRSEQEDGFRPASYCTEETECTQMPQPTENRCVFYVGFDGSGLYSPDENSAIGKFYKMIPGPPALGDGGKWSDTISANTTRAYIEGVPGVVFGDSAERVDRGLNAVCEHLDKREETCDIILMGYSRGAVIANQVAIALNKDGCDASGRHKGEEIAFFGSFDPVITSMGWEWENHKGVERPWTTTIPSNVKRFQQIFKSGILDPRIGLELILATSPHDESDAKSACTSSLTKSEHPKNEDWHHGEIGHFSLPRNIMLCSLEQHGIEVEYPTCEGCVDSDKDGWGWEDGRSCKISPSCATPTCQTCNDANGDGWGWEDGQSCKISPECAE